ncbi:VCBS repeat-containing protein [Snuella lapsa]|uniref:Cytochrome c domain-containing protein n=1 Tax=Snuella lapsa TaxID=870481 RepID=A0ABP6X5X1_9FLAO
MTSLKIVLGTLVLLSIFLLGPQSVESRHAYRPIDDKVFSDSIMSGEQLAKIYCKMCHLFPEPNLLDKETWVSGVLPNMALRLGIRANSVDPYEGLLEEEVSIIKPLGVYPEASLLSVEQWNKIVDYYVREAPSEPLGQKRTSAIANIGLPNFKVKSISIGDKPLPMTSMLKFDDSNAELYVGDAQGVMYVMDSKMRLKNTWPVSNAPVDIDFPKGKEPRVLSIGVFRPSDQKLGSLTSLYKDKSSGHFEVDLQQLPRPVQFQTGDLNMDGKEDIVICGFGNHSGKLFWLDNFEVDKAHVLKEMPGARKVVLKDLNNDNKLDIVVLMAQAWEQMSIFYNQGNNTFREKTVLRFPPVYGVSCFELTDFNKDGYLDILITNGDNWDFSPIRKNYHGVRIYLNDGQDNFEEAYFYPLYGATKAVARDFDADGDLDIAAISFYSDFDIPEQSFVYLSNEGNMEFKAFSTPEAANGKWLTMEVADLDVDGDLDIVLGSYFHNVGEMTKLIFKGVLSFPQIIVLNNELK